jgi:phosphotriesterase-related protein
MARPGISEIVSMVMPHYKPDHIFEDVLPVLRKAGITEEQITTMMVDNPRLVFEGA